VRLNAILALDPARLKTTYVVRPYIRRNGLWALTSKGEQEDGRTIQALCRGRGTVHPRHFFELIPDPPLRFGEPAMLARVLARAPEHPGLLVGIDSIRRAFKGEDISSDVADTFFRDVLLPLRAAGAPWPCWRIRRRRRQVRRRSPMKTWSGALATS
jgi:hypothetical protein